MKFHRKSLLPKGILVALLLAAATVLPAAAAAPPAAPEGWLIAAFPLEDLAPAEGTRGLGEEIAATLTDGFARSGKVRVVERKRLQTILEEIKMSAYGLVDERTAIQAGRLLGANALVMGSFLKFGDGVRINVRVVRTETGEILATERASGKFSALFDLAEKLAAAIVPRLDSPIPPPAAP